MGCKSKGCNGMEIVMLLEADGSICLPQQEIIRKYNLKNIFFVIERNNLS